MYDSLLITLPIFSTSISYTLLNVIFGVGVSILYYSLQWNIEKTESDLPKQIGLLANIYDIGKHTGGETGQIFAIVAFVFVACTGLISLVSVYTCCTSTMP